MTAAQPSSKPRTSRRRTSTRTTPSPVAPSTRPRRRGKHVPVSDLTRKYRQGVPEFDEELLIGDATADLLMQGEFHMLIADDSLKPTSIIASPLKTSTGRKSSKTSRVHSPDSQPPISSSQFDSSVIVDSSPTDVAAVTTAESPDSALAVRKRAAQRLQTTISHSRFPTTWDDAIDNAGNAVLNAFSNGYDRLRVEIRYPQILTKAPKVSPANFLGDDAIVRKAVYIAHIVLGLIDTTMKSMDEDTIPSIKRNFFPRGIVILFNSQTEVDGATPVLNACEKAVGMNVRVGVLGQVDMGEFISNLVFVVAPCNRRGNPGQIEAVELVHYSNFNVPNWVVILDPDLVALTNYSSISDQPRQPVLLSDYLTAYHLDPVAYPSEVATGAVLRCFPRKWELYLKKAQNPGGFRLVSEQSNCPSAEKIYCEFSWRVEGDRM